MGRGRRDSPLTDKTNASGKHCGMKYAVASMQGWRLEMEDNHYVSLSLPGRMKQWACGAVFDGHSGMKASKYSCRRLPKNICRIIGTPQNILDNPVNGEVDAGTMRKHEKLRQQDIKDGIIDGFLKLDESMRNSGKVDDYSGTTAICTLISPNNFYFANCGHSRALLCRNGKVHFATVDHKPTRRTEKRRIVKAGGCVRRKRINGRLALSRALGDFDYKDNFQKRVCEQMVIPKPDVTVIERDFRHDEFIVIACDGIWDVMSNLELIRFIKTQMGRTNNLKEICNRVLDRCLNKNSGDNMTIVLIVLPGFSHKVDETQKRKLQQMNQTLKLKKLKRSESNTSVCSKHTGNSVSRLHSGVSDNAYCIKRSDRPRPRVNPFIMYFLDYWRARGGNICKVAKRCGGLWHKLPKAEKAKYQKRYKRYKRKLQNAHNKPTLEVS